MRYFYYNAEGEKIGSFSGTEIKNLAKAGMIQPKTVIETEDGKQYHAHGIGGIEFGDIPVLEPFIATAPPVPISTENQTNELPTDTKYLELQTQLLALQNQIENNKSQKGKDAYSTFSGTLMALIVFFIVIPTLIWIAIIFAIMHGI